MTSSLAIGSQGTELSQNMSPAVQPGSIRTEIVSCLGAKVPVMTDPATL